MRSYEISAFIGPAIGFFGIVAAIILNWGWWSITDNAISDMGQVSVRYWYVLDISFIISGIVTLYSTFFIINYMKGHIEKYGLYFFMVSMALLSLIGFFPEGTSIHWEISVLFFLIGTFSMFAVGIGMATNGNSTGFWIIGITFGGFISAILSSTILRGLAIPELLGATGIVLSYYLTVYERVMRDKN